MFRKLLEKLPKAEGRSEFVIVVFCDVRDYSAFSSLQESVNIAEFIKKLYIKLLEEYFPNAVFAKTTGDGLLLIFRYSENSLQIVANDVLASCFRAISDFKTFFSNDPMINFQTPDKLGFGIARGTACCLFSKKTTIDYSGKILNLAARLNDLARPEGIIIDSAFQRSIIPDSMKDSFNEESVYLRSISESVPYPIFCSSHVKLPSDAYTPYCTTEWARVEKNMLVRNLLSIPGTYRFDIPEEILSNEKAKLVFKFRNPKIKEFSVSFDIVDFKTEVDASGVHIIFDTKLPKEKVKEYKLKKADVISFDFQYIPKPTC